MSDSERGEIKAFLLANGDLNNNCNRLKRGAISAAVAKFNCGHNTIGMIWSRVLESWNSGKRPADVRNRK